MDDLKDEDYIRTTSDDDQVLLQKVNKHQEKFVDRILMRRTCEGAGLSGWATPERRNIDDWVVQPTYIFNPLEFSKKPQCFRCSHKECQGHLELAYKEIPSDQKSASSNLPSGQSSITSYFPPATVQKTDSCVQTGQSALPRFDNKMKNVEVVFRFCVCQFSGN